MAGNYISKSRHIHQEDATQRSRDRTVSQRLLIECWKQVTENSWISRESPEGGCVLINDASSQTRLLDEILKQKRTVTSYDGYVVNEEDNLDPVALDDFDCKAKCVDSFPIEIVDLPEEPDGKQVDVHFVKEGNLDETTQTYVKPEDIDCGVSIRSMSSDQQHWSFSLYNFEDNGRLSREDLTNLVKSIYDALGKSMDKTRQKNSNDAVKKVKVHISLSKDKRPKHMQGTAVVPRREVAIGAEDATVEAEKQLERLQLNQNTSLLEVRGSKRRKEEYSAVHVLNNDLRTAHVLAAKCKCSCNLHDRHESRKHYVTTSAKNNNVLADKPRIPTRRETEPGGSISSEPNPGYISEELAKLQERKLKIKSQKRPARRRSASLGYQIPSEDVAARLAYPVGRCSGHHSPVGHFSGRASPVPITAIPKNKVPLDPSYAYHPEDRNYVYVHATPRHTPFEKPKAARRDRSKHRKPRDGDNPPGFPYPTEAPVVHRHEHVHHHYHHYGEKP